MYRILIVEDDPGIGEAIASQAKSWELVCRRVTDFQKVMEDFTEFQPHLVLMDIGLPFFDGYYWCGRIRQVSKVPILFLSSASDNMNVIMAINLGADDFIAKPFDSSVLLAKIGALLRRAYDFTGNAALLQHRGAILNLGDGSLTYQEHQIPLTKNEYHLLQTLMANKGNAVSREKLMEKLWQTDSFVDENTLSVNVGRLRRKLEGAGLENFIETKFGVGYIIK